MPLLIFSSVKLPGVDALSDLMTINDHASALAHLFADEQMCEFDAVIVASAPDFHISQLRSSSSTAHSLLRRYRNAASSCHLPYLSASPSQETAAKTSSCAAAKQLARKCNAKYIQILVDDNASTPLNNQDKHVLCLDAASDDEKKSENPLDILAAQLTAFTSLFPSHLVALSGVPTLSKRKATSHTLGSPAIDEAFATSAPTVSSSSTPLPAESYRLLTPPLILSLGIVFGLIVPFVLLVISALAGIKSPVRESASGKGRVVGIEKKNQ